MVVYYNINKIPVGLPIIKVSAMYLHFAEIFLWSFRNLLAKR